MQDERPEAGELADFAAHLAALTPRAEIDRDRLMFEAGGRAARGRLLVVNRLLAAACVLLVATTVGPLVRHERAEMLAQEERQPSEPKRAPTNLASPAEKGNDLPNQLVAADGRELAAAIAEGRGDLRPARLRDAPESPNNATGTRDATPARPKPSRELMREYLESGGEYL